MFKLPISFGITFNQSDDVDRQVAMLLLKPALSHVFLIWEIKTHIYNTMNELNLFCDPIRQHLLIIVVYTKTYYIDNVHFIYFLHGFWG